MDAFSSSFISSLSPTTIIPKPILTPSSSNYISRLNISSVRIEDKPATQVTSTTPTPTPTSQSPSTKSSSAVPKRRAEPTVPTLIFNAFDDIINNFIDPPTKPSVDPRHVLSNNFAPVDELPPTECEVIQGSLPPCLDGAYIRNGPNPQYLPRGPYHLFDGDGMLHSIKISQGRAIFCSRYVNTNKYIAERDAGSSLLPNVFSGFNGLTASAARGALSAVRILAGQYNPANGIGLANTSLAFFGDRLYALGESDLPYAVRLTSNGDIETIGRHDFDGKLFMSMTAHPKTDPDTKETFAFRYGPVPPFLTYFRFNSDGSKQPDVPIFSMTSPSFLHDFAITNKYAIFGDIQIGMNPTEMIFGGGSPVGSDPNKVPRLGVIPRYAKDESEMRWFDVPPKHQGHIFYSIKNLIRTHYRRERDRGIMALKNCFQVSSMCSARAGLVQCYQPISSIEKLHLATCKGLNNKSNTSSFARSVTSRSRNRNALILCKARGAVDEVQVVTDSNWESLVIGSESPVLVEFWAPWCGPCRMIAPVMDELAKEYAGKIYCFKLNTDDCPNIATEYGIRSIPTVLFFKNGEKKESVIGAVPKSTLSATIEKYLEN